MKKKYDISLDGLKNILSDESGMTPTPKEIDQTEEALIGFAQAHAVPPPASLRDKVLGKLADLKAQKKNQQSYDLDNLPPLDGTSNWLEWEATVKGIEPPNDFENVHLHPLESNDQRELFVAWVKEYVEEEVHHDLLESFLILDGTCECHITDEASNTRIVRMCQGDFITMQLGETHDIIVTSLKPAKAVLEWRKLAA